MLKEVADAANLAVALGGLAAIVFMVWVMMRVKRASEARFARWDKLLSEMETWLRGQDSNL